MSAFPRYEQVTAGSGPGSRGSDCDICTMEMEESQSTATHNSCQNTFHTFCLTEWFLVTDSNGQEKSCPKCRARFIRAPLSRGNHNFGVPLTEFTDADADAVAQEFVLTPTADRICMNLYAVTHRYPDDAELFDYDMQSSWMPGQEHPVGLPAWSNERFNPALVHRIHTQPAYASAWLSRYFVNRMPEMADDWEYAPVRMYLRRNTLAEEDADSIMMRLYPCCEELDSAEGIYARVETARIIDQSLTPQDTARMPRRRFVTDLERVTPATGRRRVRAEVIQAFQVYPHATRIWYLQRMERIRRRLHFTEADTAEVSDAFFRLLNREIAYQNQNQLQAAQGTATGAS